MDPTEAELQAIDGLDAAARWAGLEGELRASLLRSMGGLQRVREVPLIPRPTWDTTVGRIRIGEGDAARELTPVEAARIESFRRVCFLRVGRPTDSPGDVVAGDQPFQAHPFHRQVEAHTLRPCGRFPQAEAISNTGPNVGG